MLKQLLFAAMLLATTTSYAQNIPLFFHADDALNKSENAPQKHNTDDNTYLFSKRDRIKMGIREDEGRTPTNSYFFFKKYALKDTQTKTLNDYLYNHQKYDLLQKVSILNFTSQRSTVINAEVFTANFGPVRVGLGGSFQTTKSDDSDKAISANLEKIRNQGGTLSINGLFPMMYLRSRGDAYHLGLFAQQQFGLTPNKIDTNGTTTYSGENTNLAMQSGIFLHMDAGSKNEKGVSMHLYADISYFYTYGNYYDVLKMADFGVLGLRVGLNVGDLVHFNATGPLYATSLSQRYAPYTIGIQFSPSQVATAVNDKKEDKKDTVKKNNDDNDDE